MDYLFESLGDDRFQHLAQALLVAAHPDAQCLPVGQPDGGRDAFIARRGKASIVFQVKYSRSPSQKSERDVILEVIASESKKVSELKKRGVQSYYLITNVSGTSHLDVGSIDRINSALTDYFEIPSYCWWRDDLNRRIDSNSDVKWSYPDILRGSDILQLLVEGAWRENSDLRNQALQSYIATQFKDDEEVKFKQVELQNKILNLFVDLPVSVMPNEESLEIEGDFRLFHHFDDLVVDIEEVDVGSGIFYHRQRLPNTAELLLKSFNIPEFSSLVIEGAPGQGKSTITQYICQVNRIKLLNRSGELSQIPKAHAEAPVQIPFRVDLRDYATWVSGRSVFSNDPQHAPRSASLESFLAAQVFHLSGGQDFGSSDLVAVIRHGHALIVLDGFDEVADIPTRQKVVEEITRAATRLQAHQKLTQIVVTSRPAAFANSPGFARSDWIHLELQSMTTAQIEEYGKKWMAARNLPTRERAEFSALLKEKLEQPHMRDLSRNPMQLTILLALIHTRGLSLPDKRTALYDSYMDLFFSRESEKSRIVREHRDLLVDIHRYLAWVLHTDAESGTSGGIIAENELRLLLKNYLEKEGHDSGLVEELFTGMVERVVALVSRVQGTFEFEVQPLREYFAARHLYDTAPYSPPGDEKRGTKPERFDALARNFYWLNVSRFFCGCFSRGELSSLSDGLVELSRDSIYRTIAHPYQLCVMLLEDWVFSQQPLLVSRVVDLIMEAPGFKILVSTLAASVTEIALPDRCGRNEIAVKAYELLVTHEGEDRGFLLDIIRSNTDAKSCASNWLSDERGTKGSLQWLADGARLGVFRHIDKSTLLDLAHKYKKGICRFLVASDRFDIIFSDVELIDESMRQILNGEMELFPQHHRHEVTEIEFFGILFSPYILVMLLPSDRNLSHFRFLVNGAVSSGAMEGATPEISDALKRLRKVATEISEILRVDRAVWSSSLDSWRKLYEMVRISFGNSWATTRIAIHAASIQSRHEQGVWPPSGWFDLDNLVDVMRFARLRSGNVAWWREQLDFLHLHPEARSVVLAAFASWATPRTIESLGLESGFLLDTLSDEDWTRVYNTSLNQRRSLSGRKIRGTSSVKWPENSFRVKIIFAQSLKDDELIEFIEVNLLNYNGKDVHVLSFIGKNIVRLTSRRPERWRKLLPYLTLDRFGRELNLLRPDMEALPEDLAHEILTKSGEFSSVLVRAAQEKIAREIGFSVKKLGLVADSDGWFK